MSRPVWPSKIGSMPHGMVAVKGYGNFRPGRRPKVGELIEWKDARRYRRRHRRNDPKVGDEYEWTADWWQPWQTGVVVDWRGGIILISRR